MPHVSRYPLPIKVEEEIVQNLNLIFSTISKGEDMLLFFNSLFTPTEKVMVAKRMATIVLVEEGMRDSEISRLLHATEPTVAKMRLFYEARPEGFRVALKKLKEQKRLKEFKETLLSLVEFIGNAQTGHLKKTFGT